MAKIGDAFVPGAQPLDRGQARRGVGADVDDDDRSGAPSLTAFDDADGHAAGAEQSRDLPFEFFVVADDRCCKLGHRSS